MAKQIESALDPRSLMKMAIEEMHKSQNEPRPDGKVPPLVGAVIFTADGKVHRAYRGELRDGDHAEYTLIERKLVNVKLDGAVLFTTLEPCVKRNSPKVPCCRRTSNARIKKVYVGIEDPDPTVDGKGIEHLNNCDIEVEMFDRDLQRQITEANKEFIKQAVERKSAAPNLAIVREMEKPVEKTYDDFSAEALQKFIIEAKLSYRIEDENFKQYLTDLGALVIDNETGIAKATMAGILLFGLEPRLIYKQASLKAHIRLPNGSIEQTDFDEALVLLPEKIENWLKKVLPLHKDTSGFKRQDMTDFPLSVLREAVINAIVHRDYDIVGAKSALEIEPDKIVVKSPGRPLPVITLEQLNTFSAPSISRNPIITYVFNKMDYVEEKGFGMQSLKSLNRDFSLPLPEYTFTDPLLILTFPRNMAAVRTVSILPGIDQLSAEEIKGYEFIKSREMTNRKEYELEFDLNTKTAERQIKKMVDLHLVEKTGAGRNTGYKVTPLNA
jgi:ATP-dependent DNA helicase RecG